MADLVGMLDKLALSHELPLESYELLLSRRDPGLIEHAARLARKLRDAQFGREVFVRGLLEVTNYCKDDCLYCGIRHRNARCERYRLSEDLILECCERAYRAGLRTFVLQGGEDPALDDAALCGIVGRIKGRFPDCAVTLSLGERSAQSYGYLRQAGVDRYLLRHETIDRAHYEALHPKEMSHARRMECLYDLKRIGYQVGCGFMVGSPFQTDAILARELKFLETFQPHMCGIGPFIPHSDTMFAQKEAGSLDLSCYLLSLIRLICPDVLLPATTALDALDRRGYEKGLHAGANVIMANITPQEARARYDLYEGKAAAGLAFDQDLSFLARRLDAAGYGVAAGRGDSKRA